MTHPSTTRRQRRRILRDGRRHGADSYGADDHDSTRRHRTQAACLFLVASATDSNA